MRGRGEGWVTAEYGMLPGSTPNGRVDREAARGKQASRTVEIQRLIGRSLRQCVNSTCLGEVTIQVDCDVLEADGGTRTASISGGCVAVYDALRSIDKQDSFSGFVGAVSVGIVEGEPILDMEYTEDSSASTDLNVVCLEGQGFVEVQGTAEQTPFSRDEFNALLDLADHGIQQIIKQQREAVALET